MKNEGKITRVAISIFIALGILINILYSIDGNLLGTTTERWIFVELVFFMLYGFTAGMFLPVGRSPRWLLIIPLAIIFGLYYYTLFHYMSFRVDQQWEGAALWLLYPIVGIATAAVFHQRNEGKMTEEEISVKYLAGGGITFFVSLCMTGTTPYDKFSLIIQFLYSTFIFYVCYGMSARIGDKEHLLDTGISKLEKIIFLLFILLHLFFIIVAYRAPYYPNTHSMLVSALCITGYVFLIGNKQLVGYYLVIASLLLIIVIFFGTLLEQWMSPWVVRFFMNQEVAVRDHFFAPFAILTISLSIIQLVTVGIFIVRASKNS
jgi:hypothetical protein